MGRVSPKPVFTSQTWVINYVSGSIIPDDQNLQEVCDFGATTNVPITVSTSGSSFASLLNTGNLDVWGDIQTETLRVNDFLHTGNRADPMPSYGKAFVAAYTSVSPSAVSLGGVLWNTVTNTPTGVVQIGGASEIYGSVLSGSLDVNFVGHEGTVNLYTSTGTVDVLRTGAGLVGNFKITSGSYNITKAAGVWAQAPIKDGSPSSTITDSIAGYFEKPTSGVSNYSVYAEGLIYSAEDIQAANLKSNANIYVNHDGADGNSFIYFFDDGSPTGQFIRWENSVEAFDFTRSIRTTHDMYINFAGADGDSYLYFYENSSVTGASLKWDDSETEFSFNQDITVNNSPVSDKPYGELYEYNDGGSTIAITTAGTFYGWVTATSGSFNRMTADLSNGNADHIIVQDAGTYFVAASITVDGEVNAIVDGTVCLNGTPQQNLHFHRDMGTSANEGVASISGLLVCVADDEISLRFTSDTNGDDVIAHHINLTMHHLTA